MAKIERVNYLAYTIKRAEGEGGMLAETYTSHTYAGGRIEDDSLLGRLHSLRQVKHLVCITMCNEGKTEFLKTMRGVVRDVRRMVASGHLVNPDNQFCVVLIVDGIEKV